MIDKVRRKTIARVEEISHLLVRTYLVDDDDASSRVDPGGYLEMYGSLAQSRCTGEPRLVFGLRIPVVRYCHDRSVFVLASVLNWVALL
jgi:hypothetical protein